MWLTREWRVGIRCGFAASFLALFACTSSPGASGATPVIELAADMAYPHDPTAFTQGLLWKDGALWESTGLRGRSSLRRVDLATGVVLASRQVESRFFAEGLAVTGRGGAETFLQLTWQAGVALAYEWNGAGFVAVDRGFQYSGEGWGLTTLDGRLVMSDGTQTLRFLAADGTSAATPLTVTDDQPVGRLNELEAVDGWILANVWFESDILVIDPGTGRVSARLRVDEASWLGAVPEAEGSVLNGVAFDPGADKLYVTGKLWPRLFEVDWARVREKLP